MGRADGAMISAFVITCDDDPLILQATLAAASWADELILIDKSRSDPVVLSPSSYVLDRFLKAPWSPTVERTRALGVKACSHDWIVRLDADEILSAGCERTFREFVEADVADVLMVPIKHYTLGKHAVRTCAWPEFRPTLSRRGMVEYGSTVHAGERIVGRIKVLDPNGDIFITHLSSPDVAAYIEKINRYTSVSDRSGTEIPPSGQLIAWATAALQIYVGRDGWGADDRDDVIAILRGLYDVVDGLKRWEATQPNGREAFSEIAYREIERCLS